jgi:hypothetical protein
VRFHCAGHYEAVNTGVNAKSLREAGNGIYVPQYGMALIV